MERVQMVPAIRKKKGEVQTAHGTGLVRRWTTTLISIKIIAAKAAAMMGAMQRPAKIAPKP
jgi:hypothetical protein